MRPRRPDPLGNPGDRKAGIDQQAGEPSAASAVGGSGADAVRYDPGMRKEYLHRCHQKAKGVAKVAAARKLAVRLYWRLRTQTAYPEIVRIESSPRVPWSAQARPQDWLGALASRTRRDVRIEESWSHLGAVSMVGGTVCKRPEPPQVIRVRFPESCSSASLVSPTASKPPGGGLCLTEPSLLSRGTRCLGGFGRSTTNRGPTADLSLGDQCVAALVAGAKPGSWCRPRASIS